MAYVVARGTRRFELRESLHTPAGPRAKTLATFRVLDDEAMDRARSRAAGTLDADELRRAARRLGAPVADSCADASARALLSELSAGRHPTPGLVHLLQEALRDAPSAPGELPGDLAQWVGASDRERGDALVQLLHLADALPTRRSGALRAPRLCSRSANG